MEEQTSFWKTQATTIKGLVIFILMLILLIPALMVEGIINEREGRRNEAIFDIGNKWGRNQTLGGPVLVVPYENVLQSSDGKTTTKETNYAYFLPEKLNIGGKVDPSRKHRGIFEVVTYLGSLTLDGVFIQPNLSQLIPAGANVLWDKAILTLGISDLRGLADQVRLKWNDNEAVFDPGIPVTGVAESGIHLPIVVQGAANGRYVFHIDLQLKGSGSLFFTPVGKVTDVKLSSPWPDPSFVGAFLPDQKNITPNGFDAAWKVLNLNRNYPQQWISDQNIGFGESAFGVEFLMPVDNYQKATRSVKYAILFIGLTFLTVFFIEMRQSKRVHPFQYALIGLALVIFYTLLVSISEHLPYNQSYWIAALMTVGLTGWYARMLFASNRMGLFLAGTLTVLYGFLFVVLQQQDYALLIGSLGLFAILAIVMYFSKMIDVENQ